LDGISSSKLIKRINGNSHIVLLQVSNPLLSYFQATPLYVQVDFSYIWEDSICGYSIYTIYVRWTIYVR